MYHLKDISDKERRKTKFCYQERMDVASRYEGFLKKCHARHGYLQPPSFEECLFNCYAINNPNTVNVAHPPHSHSTVQRRYPTNIPVLSSCQSIYNQCST